MPTAAELLFDASSIEEAKRQVLGLIPIFDRVAQATKGATVRAATERVRAEGDANRQIERAHAEALRENARRSRDAQREQDRIRRDAERAEKNFIRAGMYAISQAEEERTRKAQAEARKRTRIAEAEADEADRILKRRARAFGSLMGGATGRVMGLAGRVAGVAGAIGGGFAVADSLRAGIDEEKASGVIFRGAVNQGGFTNQGQVAALARATAIGTGGTTQDILGGLDLFVRKTGDLETAKAILGDMAKLSAATGTNFADMGNTAAEVENQLHDASKTMEVMRALAGQGRAGAIDIKDLGMYGGRLAASAAQFGGSLSGNIESFGVLAQLAKKSGGATDTAEATEAVARISSDMIKNEAGFKGLGIDIFTDKSRTKLIGAEDAILKAVVNSKGDISKLNELFGERSIKAARGAQVIYANAGGGAAGESAIRGEFAALHATTMTQEQIDKGARERMAETSAKLNIAMEKFHAALNDKLLPLLPSMVEKFTQLIPVVQRVIEFFTGGTLGEGIAKAVGVAFALEIGKGAITMGANSLFTSLAEKFLGLFSSQKTAVANIQAGVVHVAGGGGVPGVPGAPGVPPVLDKAKDLLLSGGGAIVGGAGTLLGAGANALGALTVLGFEHLGNKREAQGADELKAIMSMPEGSPEERSRKLVSLQGAEKAGKAGQHFHELAMRGQENDLRNFTGGNDERMLGMDRKSMALAKQMDAIEAELTRLKDSIGTAATSITNFGDAVKPPPGTERSDVPTGAVRNGP